MSRRVYEPSDVVERAPARVVQIAKELQGHVVRAHSAKVISGTP